MTPHAPTAGAKRPQEPSHARRARPLRTPPGRKKKGGATESRLPRSTDRTYYFNHRESPAPAANAWLPAAGL